MNRPSTTRSHAAAWLRTLTGSPYGRVPIAGGLGGAAVMVLAAGPTAAVSLVAAMFAAAGFLAASTLARHHAQALAAAKHECDAEVARVNRLCAQSAPVWIRQIETVRGEADAEVGELARVFGEIAARLDHVMGGSPLAPNAHGIAQDEILAGLARNGRELGSLVAALKLLQKSKERIVDEIGDEAAHLKENAADIRQIALNIRIVSLNATIEAARAGAAGKPFGVIVADMRELAARTAETSELFSRHTDRLHGMVSAAFKEQQLAGSDLVSIAGAEELVQNVVTSSASMLRQLTEAIAAMAAERKEVREDISRALVALQFQDRVSQILSHVTHNLEEMQARIQAGRWSSMDDGQWLQRMASSYSTHEEFGNHRGSQPSAVQAGSAVTFF